MAVVKMGVDTGGDNQKWLGLKSEIDTVPTTNLGPGSTYWAKDEKKGYIWDGVAWWPLS